MFGPSDGRLLGQVGIEHDDRLPTAPGDAVKIGDREGLAVQAGFPGPHAGQCEAREALLRRLQRLELALSDVEWLRRILQDRRVERGRDVEPVALAPWGSVAL